MGLRRRSCANSEAGEADSVTPNFQECNELKVDGGTNPDECATSGAVPTAKPTACPNE
ncbi:MAG: hypothetical protein K9G70_05025 [Prolixibacteraceae bacterium]|nr:hypothetical protein [Prolixibacteraceae bacterium]